MANINKIQLSGNVYDIEDVNATKTIELTQAEYDALAEIDPNAFYVISDAEGIDVSNFYTKDEVDNEIYAAVSGKQETLVSGTNIKTINNTSILGSGNIDIQGGGGSVTVDSELSTTSENPVQNKVITNALSDKAQMIELTQAEYNALVDKDPDTLYVITDAPTIDMSNYYSKDETDDLLDEKQETLVSGTNIKTINNTSILGSGNINIQGGGSSYTAGDGIDITNDVISVTGKASTSAVTQVNTTLTAHTANTNVHVTAAEKETWNSKSDFSGDYNDLTNKPTIPVVPTNVSAFNNDSGYITSNAITSKADTTAVTQVNNALTAHTANTTVHVTTSEKNSWNNKSNFSGSYDDLTNKPTIPVVPTNVSDFTNDAGYITIDVISGKADTSAVTEINYALTAHTADTSIHIQSGGEVTYNLTDVSGAAGGTYLNASWSGNCEGITELTDGMNIQIKIPNGGHKSGVTISINGGEKHRCILNANTSVTVHYPANTILRFVYDANQSANVYTGSSTPISVQGVWKIANYDSNSNAYTTGLTVTTTEDTNTITVKGNNAAVKGTAILSAATTTDAGLMSAEDKALLETISGKADASAVTQAISAAVSGKADTSTVTSLSNVVTAHTADTTIHTTSAEKTSWNAKLDASDVEGFFGAVNYDSQTKRINFYNTSTGGTVLGYVDATDFIKDGMVSNVEIKTITSGGSQVEVIAITFNADAGKEEIDIPLTDVFDPNNYYTKTEVDNLIPTVPTSNTAFTNDAQYATSGYVDSAVSGKADTSAFTAHTANTTIHTTSAEKTSWNGAVTDVATVSASTAANTTALGGLKLVKLTQAEYDALTTKDSSTVYFING